MRCREVDTSKWKRQVKVEKTYHDGRDMLLWMRHVKVEETYQETCQVEVQIRLSGGGPRPGGVERSEEEKKKKQNPGERESVYRSSLSKKPH